LLIEVKNPLAGVREAIQVIGTHLPKESKDAAIVKDRNAYRCPQHGLMQDLLLFARPPQPKPAPVDLAALIGDDRGLAQRRSGARRLR
jgi:hypothetical protein